MEARLLLQRLARELGRQHLASPWSRRSCSSATRCSRRLMSCACVWCSCVAIDDVSPPTAATPAIPAAPATASEAPPVEYAAAACASGAIAPLAVADRCWPSRRIRSTRPAGSARARARRRPPPWQCPAASQSPPSARTRAGARCSSGCPGRSGSARCCWTPARAERSASRSSRTCVAPTPSSTPVRCEPAHAGPQGRGRWRPRRRGRGRPARGHGGRGGPSARRALWSTGGLAGRPVCCGPRELERDNFSTASASS